MNKTDPKIALSEAIEELEGRRVAALSELQKLELGCDAAKRDVETLTEQRARACEALARGERNSVAELDAKIATAAARVRGFERLTETKRVEIQRINAESDPLARELQTIRHEEVVAQARAGIAAEEKTGMQTIKQRDELQASHVRRIIALRQMDGDERVVRFAHEAAERLERVGKGMTP